MEAEAKLISGQGTPRRRSRGERTRQEILARAVQIASAEGLENLTIGRLANELEMSKSGLFAHFGSKEELQLATIDTAREIFIREVVGPVRDTEPGLARLLALMKSWVSYAERSVFRGGCFFAAASAEFDGRPGPVRDHLVEVTKSWRDALENEVRRARELSQLDATVDPAQLAFELHAYGLEANWAHQLFDDQRAFEQLRDAVRRCLERAVTPAGLKVLESQPKARKKTKK